MPQMTQEQFKKRKALIEKLVVFPSTENTPAEFRFHGRVIRIITDERIKSKKLRNKIVIQEKAKAQLKEGEKCYFSLKKYVEQIKQIEGVMAMRE